MVTNIGIDTPDWQYGIVNPQALLSADDGSHATVIVDIPPNAETLIVALTADLTLPVCGCQGQTTGINYPGVQAVSQWSVFATQSWFFDVSNTVDEQVSIGFINAPGAPWFVYADSGVHITADVSSLGDSIGRRYTLPSIPSTQKGDHPPYEVSVASFANTASGSLVLPAAGAGKRYRIFYANLWCTAGLTGWANYTVTVGGANILNVGGAGAGFGEIDLKPTGFPCATNGAIQVNSTAGSLHGNLVYSNEVV